MLNEELIERAKNFAFERHAGQMYGQHPYTFHLQMVVGAVRAHGGTTEQVVAAWLHDTEEDTGTTREELQREFGEPVEALVYAVTGEGETRMECLESATRKIAITPGSGLLKAADRYSHVKCCLDERLPKFLRWYVDEHPTLRPVLPECELTDRLDALIELATAYLERESQPSPQGPNL